MYRTRHSQTPKSRRGVILLVVITLLTLFAVVGLTFALYAESEANASRIYREGEDQAAIPTDDLASIFSFGLGDIIYDVPDDATGVYCAVRGHSLARLVYGWNDPGTANPNLNLIPFNGTGRWHTNNPNQNWPYQNPFNVDDFQLASYVYWQNAQVPDPQPFLRDPEKLGSRANLNAPAGQYTGGFNAPYTYPDGNNMFLAAVKSDGTVLLPSFHRPWLFNPNNALNDQTNPNWHNAVGKYLIMRPRPDDHWQTAPNTFPYPADATGDVKNLAGAPGGNDSIWIDLNAPGQAAAQRHQVQAAVCVPDPRPGRAGQRQRPWQHSLRRQRPRFAHRLGQVGSQPRPGAEYADGPNGMDKPAPG
jgi:hypothetical protein